MNFKRRVAEGFDKAAPVYHEHAHLQRMTAKKCADAAHRYVRDASRILDVGTGTGFMVDALAPFFPHATYTLNDLSDLMLQEAKQRLDPSLRVKYELGDAERQYFKNAPYDLMVSNLTFQWFESLRTALPHLFSQSTNLCFSLPIQGTFSEWNACCAQEGLRTQTQDYPGEDQVVTWCRDLSSDVLNAWVEEYTMSFETPMMFLRHLRLLGASTSAVPGDVVRLRRVMTHFSEGIDVLYRILYVVMSRKN